MMASRPRAGSTSVHSGMFSLSNPPSTSVMLRRADTSLVYPKNGLGTSDTSFCSFDTAAAMSFSAETMMLSLEELSRSK